MMKYTKRTFLICFLALMMSLFQGNMAQAQSGAERHVIKIANDVMQLARSGSRGSVLHGRFVRLLGRYANMNAVARFALGRYSRKLPNSQKQKYYKLVKAYVAGLFVYYANDFKGQGLEIISSRKSGKFTIVKSQIKLGGARKPVVWRVYSSGNSHRVTDVNIRGVWMSIQMRQKFTNLLKRNGGDFNKLMAFLSEYKNWMPA